MMRFVAVVAAAFLLCAGGGAAAPMDTELEGSRQPLVNMGSQHSVNLGLGFLAAIVIVLQLQYLITCGISVPTLEDFLEKQLIAANSMTPNPNMFEPKASEGSGKPVHQQTNQMNTTWTQVNTSVMNKNQTHGRRVQDSAMCSDGAEMQEMLSICCVDGNGHRRTQTGCDSLPDQCSEVCAPVFLSFTQAVRYLMHKSKVLQRFGINVPRSGKLCQCHHHHLLHHQAQFASTQPLGEG
eukprot:SAG22_NODE_1811_length_3525_cov_12.037653_2_plen_238_part_00